MTPVFVARVQPDLRLAFDRVEAYVRHLQRLVGEPVEVIVRKPRSARSLRQNAYYWGVVVTLLAEHFGYTRDEMHEALKFHFLRRESPDRPLATVRSTASLSTGEFERYLEDVRTWAATEFDVLVPLPNEVDPAT